MADHIDSTSDQRNVNNTVRHTYRELTDEEKAVVGELKRIGEEFLATLDVVDGVTGGQVRREIALARTKAEEAVMWAVKGVTK